MECGDYVKKLDNNKPIVYSSKVREIYDFFIECQNRHIECMHEIDLMNLETQDILHTMELCSCTVQEKNKLFKSLCEIRRKRRIYKNEESILKSVIEWIDLNQKNVIGLLDLIKKLEQIESFVNGDRHYRNRTDIVKNILGTEIILSNISDKYDENFSLEKDTTSMNKNISEDHNSPNTISKKVKEKKNIKYPVVIFHVKNRKSSTYYYTFPGIDEPSVYHVFYSGGVSANIKNNKRLMGDVTTTFRQVISKKKRNIPQAISFKSIDINKIKEKLNIPDLNNVTSTLKEYVDYTIYE